MSVFDDLLGTVLHRLVTAGSFGSEFEKDLHLSAVEAWAESVGADIAKDVTGLSAKLTAAGDALSAAKKEPENSTGGTTGTTPSGVITPPTATNPAAQPTATG